MRNNIFLPQLDTYSLGIQAFPVFMATNSYQKLLEYSWVKYDFWAGVNLEDMFK